MRCLFEKTDQIYCLSHALTLLQSFTLTYLLSLVFTNTQSFLAADEPLSSMKAELPSPDDLLVCDQSKLCIYTENSMDGVTKVIVP